MPLLSRDAPVAGSRSASRLHLRLAQRLDPVALDPPWKVVRGFTAPGGELLVHLNNVSGGVLGGDQLDLVLDVAPRAHAMVTTTGATRVYRARAGRPAARQRNRISVGEDARLEYLPDQLIPFAGARFEQHTRIDLAAGATLFWWEMLAPGRVAMGELFRYERLHLTTAIHAAGEPVALERVDLQPELRTPGSLARFGPFSFVATFYVCRAGAPPRVWTDLEQSLGELAIELSRPPEVLWGVSALPSHGIVVRGLASSGRGILGALTEFWRHAKLELCGQVAVLPRKLY